MNPFEANQILEFASYLLALVNFVLAVYILMTNIRHTANRHTSGLLLIFALTNLAMGQMAGTENLSQAALPAYLLAATTPAIQPGLLIVSIALLKPQWLQGQGRWIWRLLYLVLLMPFVLTFIDLTQDTQLWYTGLSRATGPSSAFSLSDFTAGSWGPIVRGLNIYGISILTLLPLLYIALRDRSEQPAVRRLAWTLLIAQILALIIHLGLRPVIGSMGSALVSNALFTVVYTYAAVGRLAAPQSFQRNRLRTRLAILLLGITIPPMVGILTFVGDRVEKELTQQTIENLATINNTLTSNTSMWLDLNGQALQELASLPDIRSMEAQKQKPILEAMQAAYPHIYLVSTIDLAGVNVARSDDLSPIDYHDRQWYAAAKAGEPLAIELVKDPTNERPTLIAASAIKDESGQVVGVVMFASYMNELVQAVRDKVGESGFAYVLDSENQIIAHPDPAFSAKIPELDLYPPILALRHGNQGPMTFTDKTGKEWQAYVAKLENGWGIIVQQPLQESLRGLAELRRISWIAIAIGAFGLVVLILVSVHQVLKPITQLTNTATAIAAGDLDRRVEIQSRDEIGLLAQTFNSMTEQLRALIGSLEQRVNQRTYELERRSAYLEASARVSRAAASMLDTDQLTRQVVELIREWFALYYVGLFLWDEDSDWAVLRAGTGKAGRAMLDRGHRIRVGEGMIGWSIANAQPRVALQAEEDAVRLNIPELPETRSEAALPLRSRGRVLGALSVQSVQMNAFDEDTITVLQTMADQVAVALDNARLFNEGQAALDAARRAYGDLSQQAWKQLASQSPELAVCSDERGITPADNIWRPEMQRAWQEGEVAAGNGSTTPTAHPLAIPIKIRGQVVGVLDTLKPSEDGPWTPEEMNLLQEITDQLALALENARVYHETRLQAAREQLTTRITAQLRETLDIETVLRTATNEIYEALDLDELVIELSPESLGQPASLHSPKPAKGRGPEFNEGQGPEFNEGQDVAQDHSE
jgi:GAF domain-containing protein